MRCVAKATRAVVALAFVPLLASAQELQRTARLIVDNDIFDFWLPPLERPDHNYTQGSMLVWDFSTVPRVARKMICRRQSACSSSVEFGQQIYTPTNDSPFPLPGERPYAGWLYLRAAVHSGTPRTLRTVSLIGGTTGGPSLGEYVQVHFHEEFGFRRPLGWEYQLATEPAFALIGEHSWRITPEAGSNFVDFIPAISAMLGTLRTSAAMGAQLRVGPALGHPWLTGTKHPVSVHGFAGARAEAVARDLFLDGNTFVGSVRVTREPLTTELTAGIRGSVGRFGVAYEVVRKGREYRSGPTTHTYGSLSIDWRLN